MSWFRVDDKAAFHKKVLKAGNEAFGALIRMGCWSSDHLTDGRIPIETASLIASEHALQRLCFVGFLEPDGDDFIIHDYLHYNPTAEEVRVHRQETHESKVKAGQAGGIASGITRRLKAAKQNGEAPASSLLHSASVLLEANAKQNEAPSRSHPDPDSRTDSETEEAIAASASPRKSLKFDFEAIYQAYPRKEGKNRGIQRCRKQITTPEKYAALVKAVENYAAGISDLQYCKHFSSFMLEWENYIDAKPVTSSSQQKLPPSSSVSDETRNLRKGSSW